MYFRCLKEEFPDLPKLQIRIQLWLAQEPDDGTLKFLDKAAYACSVEGVDLSLKWEHQLLMISR